jgi:signal transduction histidine kinase
MELRSGVRLLPFALALWPDGRVEAPWLRRLFKPALIGLALATASEAFAPDQLDGVVSPAAIDNPLGIDALRTPLSVVGALGALAVIAFGLAVAGDVVVRGLRARGPHRRRVRPAALTIAAGALAFAVAMAVGTDQGIVAAWGVAIALSMAFTLTALGSVRADRAERARAAVIAEREEERKQLRRALHDQVGPTLAALRLQLDAGRHERSIELLDEAMQQVRHLAHDLRPAALDELGLVGAIRQHAAVIGGANGRLVVEVDANPLPPLPAATEMAALLIVGEALTNVVRHADADHCTVAITADGELRLRVADDGRAETAIVEGFGLRSMRARAEEIGGTFSARRTTTGFVVAAALPLDAS